MNKSVIQVKIFEAGIKRKQICDKSGFSEVSVYYTILHRTHNQVIQETIAELLGIPAAELWGEHYAPIWRKNKKCPRSAELTDTL
jgi:lambda repressor-like predicted transcriptional regulator